jgi:hypothetical protein
MKNAYQRRRVKARVEKRARMMRLDAITLEFARQVIEEETGAPLEIGALSAGVTAPPPANAAQPATAAGSEPRLIARDDRKNPLISSFDWTNDATQRIFRVPAGFMRSKTQERIEELARERAAASIDLGLVEEGIEIGKRMMAEMIATYPSPGASPGAATAGRVSAGPSGAAAAEPNQEAPHPAGGGYLNEVRSR